MTKYPDANSLLNPVFVECHRRDMEMMDEKEHLHNFYELYFLVDGQVDEFIENRTHHLKSMDIIIIKPNVLHRELLCKKNRHESLVVHFDIRSIVDSEILKKLEEQQGVISLPAHASKRVYKLINILLDETENDVFHNSYVRSVLTEILIVIFRNQFQKAKSYVGLKFKNIIDYVRENSRKEITLATVAQKFSVSEAHLSRLFKKNTGFTFTQYLNYQRIIYSQKMLITSNISIGKIAKSSGFESTTHFGRVFKQLAGCSPREYRKNVKTDVTIK